MNQTKAKSKREIYSVLLMLVLVGITIGYAALSTNLNINGTSKVSGNSWNIHFNNVQITNGSVLTPSPDQAATITQNDTTEVTYIVTLSKPGDFYEFTVDAVNAGTVDGMIGSITSKLNNTVIDNEHPLPVYLDYSVTYIDGVAIANNHMLAAGDTETYKIRLEFKKDIENNQLPSTDQSNAFSFKVDYVQGDSNGIEVPHPVSKYTVSSSDVNIGEAIPNNITQYSTAADAMAAFNNRPFYLKHTVQNGIVTESFVEFVITDAMANEVSGLTAGTYALRGSTAIYDDWGAQIGPSPYYEINKTILQTAYGIDNCTDMTTYYICSFTSMNYAMAVDVETSGFVSINDGFYKCRVRCETSSSCDDDLYS